MVYGPFGFTQLTERHRGVGKKIDDGKPVYTSSLAFSKQLLLSIGIGADRVVVPN
jgi:hypothetical protein